MARMTLNTFSAGGRTFPSLHSNVHDFFVLGVLQRNFERMLFIPKHIVLEKFRYIEHELFELCSFASNNIC